MDFRILGPLQVIDGERPLDLGSPKQRCLLALLALNANRVVSSDRIVDALWQGRPPRAHVATVHAYVSRLRSLLEPARDAAAAPTVLVRETPGYRLCLAPEDLDARQFEQLVDDAGRALASTPPTAADAERAAAQLDHALALWRGDVLADLQDAEFARGEATRLEQLRLEAMEQQQEAALLLGRHGSVVAEAARCLADHPYRERLRGQLMLALYRSGQQADALRVYREGRTLLVEELGIEPGPALQELEEAILLQKRHLDWQPLWASAAPLAPVGRALPAALSSVSPASFVGREDQMAMLLEAWRDTADGRSRLLLLSGEPGIGKTRLATEFARRVGGEGAVVLYGRCYEESVVPYQPFADALRQYAASAPPVELRAVLERADICVTKLAPELGRGTDEPTERPGTDRPTERHVLFDATAYLLADMAARAPILLVLDDLHWADEPTWLLLAHIARACDPTHLLIVGTYRSTELEPSFDDIVGNLRRESLIHPIGLQGLDEAAVRELISDRLGIRAPPEFCAAVHEHTDGNPFFVEQVARHVNETAACGDDSPNLDAIDLADLGVPEGVRDLISRRVRRLREPAPRVLAVASVVGREFGLDLLERVTEMAVDDLIDALDEAVTAAVVSEAPDTIGRYSFEHALTCETLYGSLSHNRRARLHQRVGLAIEEAQTDELDPYVAVLAHHFLAGGQDPARAAKYAYRAGNRALIQLAHEEAAYQFERGLAVVEDDLALQCDLLTGLAEARRRAHDEAGMLDALQAAATHARVAGDAFRFATVATSTLFSASPRRHDVEVALLEEALAGLPDEDSAIRARVLGRLSVELYYHPQWARRTALSDESIAMARRVGDEKTLLDALMFRRVALHEPAHLAERRAVIDEAIELASRSGYLEAATGARIVRAMELIESGDITAADADIEIAEQESGAFRLTSLSALTPLYYRAMRTTMSGRLADGERLTVDAYEAMHTAGYPNTFLVLMMQLYQLRWLQGRMAEIEPTVAELVAHYPDLPPGMVRDDGSAPSSATSGNAVGVVEAEWRVAWAHVLCETGRLEEARVQFDLAAANDFDDVPFDNVWTTAMIVGAEACAALGDVRRAQLLYDKLLPYADQFNLLGPLITCGGAIARTLGQLAAVLGRWTDAEAHLDAALAANLSAGAAPFVVLTQRDQARMLLARGEPGDRHRAHRLLREAGVTARELGMMPIDSTSNAGAPLGRPPRNP